MKTFDDYYKQSLKSAKIGANNHNMSVKNFIKIFHKKTMEEYKEARKKDYERKACHSFWRRECLNKGIECYRCREFYSFSEFDKISK